MRREVEPLLSNEGRHEIGDARASRDVAGERTAPPVPREQLERRLGYMLERAADLRRRPAPAGTLRGIDHYPPDALAAAMTRALARFYRQHGRWPALAPPVSFNDKLHCAKFFMPMAVPTLADKCRVGAVIPPAFHERVRPMPLAWSAEVAMLPPDAALAPGAWWLQAKLAWPPDAVARAEAETRAARWLAIAYGATTGEWWYATARRAVLLRPELASAQGPAIDYKFLCIHGRIRYLLVACDLPDGRRARSFYDPEAAGRGEWRRLPVRLLRSPLLAVPCPPSLATMCEFARTLGERHEQLRVDLLQAPGGPLHLSELTFCDMDAQGLFEPASFEAALGAGWDVTGWYP